MAGAANSSRWMSERIEPASSDTLEYESSWPEVATKAERVMTGMQVSWRRSAKGEGSEAVVGNVARLRGRVESGPREISYWEAS